jgi:hypothetical protein
MIKIKFAKKLYFLLSFSLFCIQLQAQVIYGTNNYTQYHVGTLPIIISAPHGGLVTPAGIPDRTCGSPTYDLDSKTIELARQMDTALFNLTGCHPHLIICNLRRTKVDCNRNITDGACGNVDAINAWTDFHDFIDTAQLISQNQYGGKALYIDLHGHGKQPYRLELGYGLQGIAYNNSDSTLNTSGYISASSIENLVNTNVSGSSHAQLLRGPFALGTLFANAGFPSVPSQQSPTTGGFPYFPGGYNTFHYTCIFAGSNFDGLQIECDSAVRFGYSNRKKFADSTAIVLSKYLLVHQNLNLQTNCGLTTSLIDKNTSKNNSIKVFPNPVLDILKFSSENIIGNYELIIFNALGEVVLKATNENELNVTYLTSGLYFIRLSDEQHSIWNSKMIKN